MEKEFKTYIIDSTGKVYSKKFKRYLKTEVRQNGSLVVSISHNRVNKSVSIHKLVAKVFLPNPMNKKTIIHLDGNKKNNDVSNLRWATLKENVRYGLSKGFTTRSEKSGKPKRGVLVFDLEDNKLTSHESIKATARHYGIHSQNIWKVLRGIKNTASGYKFRYEKTHKNIS